jgi:hypothetical protein
MRPEMPMRPFGFVAVAIINASRGHSATWAYSASMAAPVSPE